MYVAKAYIGRQFVPGEVLPDDLPPELIGRLVRAGAAVEVGGYGAADTADAMRAGPHQSAAPSAADSFPRGEAEKAIAEDEEDSSPEAGAGEPEDDAGEIDDSAVPEEIDVMDGLVEETEKPKSSRKSGGRKSS